MDNLKCKVWLYSMQYNTPILTTDNMRILIDEDKLFKQDDATEDVYPLSTEDAAFLEDKLSRFEVIGTNNILWFDDSGIEDGDILLTEATNDVISVLFIDAPITACCMNSGVCFCINTEENTIISRENFHKIFEHSMRNGATVYTPLQYEEYIFEKLMKRLEDAQ